MSKASRSADDFVGRPEPALNEADKHLRSLAHYVLELTPGSRCFCCGGPLLSSTRRGTGELECADCGAEVGRLEKRHALTRAA